MLIIKKQQYEVRHNFIIKFHYVGSSARNMITRERKSNTAYDFDINIE